MRTPIWRICHHEAGAYTDHCWVCAPWWEQYPLCDICKQKLKQSSDTKGYCQDCKHYFDLEDGLEEVKE